MTPKEKAKELVDNFTPHTRVFHEVLGWEDYLDSAKKCALIAVDEIIDNGNLEPQIKRHIGNVEPSIIYLEYWFKVKKEIEKL